MVMKNMRSRDACVHPTKNTSYPPPVAMACDNHTFVRWRLSDDGTDRGVFAHVAEKDDAEPRRGMRRNGRVTLQCSMGLEEGIFPPILRKHSSTRHTYLCVRGQRKWKGKGRKIGQGRAVEAACV